MKKFNIFFSDSNVHLIDTVFLSEDEDIYWFYLSNRILSHF